MFQIGKGASPEVVQYVNLETILQQKVYNVAINKACAPVTMTTGNVIRLLRFFSLCEH